MRAAALLCLMVLTGCGVAPTGVISGGEPPSGVGRGLRLYFVTDTGLRGVSRPEQHLRELDAVVKLLMAGPNRAEARAGLSTAVQVEGAFSVVAGKNSATLRLATPQAFSPTATGQLVCSLAKGHALLKGGGPDQVAVTLAGAGPYRCSQFIAVLP
ncbi:hypothetical protein AB0J63_42510 [Streptosporangium canum]|uniref:hypothetical protein n=1 Tax=Streptosporangium canum TaxID=324952 RepID=UPI00341BD160